MSIRSANKCKKLETDRVPIRPSLAGFEHRTHKEFSRSYCSGRPGGAWSFLTGGARDWYINLKNPCTTDHWDRAYRAHDNHVYCMNYCSIPFRSIQQNHICVSHAQHTPENAARYRRNNRDREELCRFSPVQSTIQNSTQHTEIHTIMADHKIYKHIQPSAKTQTRTVTH